MQAHRALKSSIVSDKLHFAEPFLWACSQSISTTSEEFFSLCIIGIIFDEY